MEGWLVIDGYEDEPAAFGVPNYLGFHIRYICGVLESRKIPYTYMTIDQWRIQYKHKLSNLNSRLELKQHLSNLDGAVILAGAIVPGKYIRGTPISRPELDQILSILPSEQPVLCGGWAIRHWRYDGWTPLRNNLFCAVQDTDASLDYFLSTNIWKNKKRSSDQWSNWARYGSSSKSVTNHPDLFTLDGRNGPLTYEVELYQGCVRFKRGCKFCIEPKKGMPIWRDEKDVLDEVYSAIDSGIRNVRLGGATASGNTNDDVTLSGGTNLTAVRTSETQITFNVDDAFLKNDGDDTTTGTITAAGLNLTAANDTPLVIQNTTNTGYAGIQFSDNSSNSYAQKGEFRFQHSDANSQGSGASFHFTTTESDLSIVGGKFIASDSATTEPGFGFAGDVDTGMYQSAANTIQFVTAGTNRMQIASGGAVSINNDVSITKTLPSNDATTLSGAQAFVVDCIDDQSSSSGPGFAIRLEATNDHNGPNYTKTIISFTLY